MRYLLICELCKADKATQGTETNKEEIKEFLKGHQNHGPKVLPMTEG